MLFLALGTVGVSNEVVRTGLQGTSQIRKMQFFGPVSSARAET